MQATYLPPLHLILAIIVVIIWGTNFSIIKIALGDLPPITFAALRFTLAFFPAMLFIRPPKVAIKNIAIYGLLIGAGQFGLLFFAMTSYISAGLASLLLQTQAFFTIALAIIFAGEKVKPYQIVSLIIAIMGILLISIKTMNGADAQNQNTIFGIILAIIASFAWGLANIISRQAGKINALAYMVWSSAAAIIPLWVLAYIVEGQDKIITGIQNAGYGTWAAVIWQSVGNTLFGYGVWSWLLARHPAAQVSPLALLVPIIGMLTAALWLNETMPAWKIIAAALVLAGLALNIFWPKIKTKLISQETK